MKKVYVIGKVSADMQSLIEKEFPNTTVVKINDLHDVKASERAKLLKEEIRLTIENINDVAYMPYVDSKPSNPWPTPHKSSKRNKRY